MSYDKVFEVLKALHEHDVEYVLVGAAAINLLGLVRPTHDLDLFIRPTEENVAKLRAALRSVWDDPEIEQIAAAELAGDIAVVRYGPPETELIVDILARLGTMFTIDDLEWKWQTHGGVPVRLATPRTIYRMKRDTLRPQDKMDAARLREKFGKEVE